MKKQKGLIIIMISIIITYISWAFIRPTRDIPAITQYSQLIAAIVMVFFCLVNFISTRHKFAEYMFNGLDKSYLYHKYLSIFSLILILIHNETIDIGKKLQRTSGIRMPKDPYAMYGSFSLYLFVALILIALLAKRLNYERWKVIHKFMIIPYSLGIYHYYGSSNYPTFSLDFFSIWMNLLNFIGIISAVYSIFIYEKKSFKYKYKVKSLRTVAIGTLEITGSALGKDLEYKPGQFAFLKVLNGESNFTSHPFTLSEAHKKGELQFTIKALGDHTKRLIETLKVGDKFSVSGPYGKFDFKRGANNQIWIAGGIGITPFRSFAQADVPKDFSIDFFYAYNSEDDAPYVEELQELTSTLNNVRLHLFNSKEKGFLTVKEISELITINAPIDVYFCGPKPMREGLMKQFKNSSINVSNFHYEHFQFK
ncbi:ferric reductase-like transmembrane domain-containing protein [Clostridium paridis]|uniref:Ferric reductase-like transmembrane domain-containing protein n=1 Tax=Clostridium paridis TaxID=2803863 RepID=A0A937K3I0_9CLOT|nr:ferric reductase-like transmembrane domain-containing protein [Clostridium paridis]MBL4931662.1 ferric reductase-like transmembrane domain-containing protein [Clostridium paridis]